MSVTWSPDGVCDEKLTVSSAAILYDQTDFLQEEDVLRTLCIS